MPTKHTFVSPITDAGDPDIVGPDEWNDDHESELGIPSTGAIGFLPVAFMVNYSTAATTAATTTLAANGGAIAMVFVLVAPMQFDHFRFRCPDTSGAKSAEGRLYVDTGANSLNEVTGTDGTVSFTPSVASFRDLTASGAPVLLDPGAYWYVLRNTHASNSLGVATATVSNTAAYSCAQTKTLGSALGSSLDFVAATWTKQTFLVSVALRGRVFGDSSAF